MGFPTLPEADMAGGRQRRTGSVPGFERHKKRGRIHYSQRPLASCQRGFGGGHALRGSFLLLRCPKLAQQSGDRSGWACIGGEVEALGETWNRSKGTGSLLTLHEIREKPSNQVVL